MLNAHSVHNVRNCNYHLFQKRVITPFFTPLKQVAVRLVCILIKANKGNVQT